MGMNDWVAWLGMTPAERIQTGLEKAVKREPGILSLPKQDRATTASVPLRGYLVEPRPDESSPIPGPPVMSHADRVAAFQLAKARAQQVKEAAERQAAVDAAAEQAQMAADGYRPYDRGDVSQLKP